MSDVFERLAALDRAMAVAGASEVRETPLGTALISPDLPHAWDANALIAIPGAARAEELSGLLDELYAGLPHRKAWVYDDAAGERLAPALRERGFETERDVVLALRGAPPGTEGPADEVSREVLRAVERAGMEQDGLEPDVIEQIVAMRDRTAQGLPTRFFVAEESAHATLYRHGDLASITDVGTHAAARGRGLARSVIALATHAALQDGARDVVLVTDAADWMQGFYVRLGFTEEAGALWSFIATER